ncbi:MAG: DUF2240 family protein [Archaeoglobaceae archaeon]|uniref:DUF2240 family protein n=1 Tax=Archaeoglobus fulgidus TaxID=2234 RepID=A0A7J3M180_ARCFL
MSFELNEELLNETIGEKLVEEIAKKIGRNIQDVFSMISERQERMGNLLSFEVVALIVAKEVGINISEFIPEVEKRIFNETPQ